MYQHEEKIRNRVAPFVEALEAEGFEAAVFHPGEYSIKISIATDGSSLGPLVVYYKPSNDTFSISDHEMTNASAFGHIESLFYQSEETDSLPGHHAYVDGSYRNGRIGYGWVVYRDGVLQHEDFGTATEFENMRQVVGELKATIEALKWCEVQDLQSVHLHYDYEGIEKWATGDWRAKNACTERYRRLISESPVDIDWVKEDAHTGVTGNERADRLAKKGTTPTDLEGESADGESPMDLIEELESTVGAFLDFVDDTDLPGGGDMEPRQVYNDDFYRLEVVQEESVVGRFDLYNTSNKHLEPRLHGFQTKEIKERIQGLWEEYCGRYVAADEAAIHSVDHLHEIFESYRQHERIDMIHLVRAIENAYSVVADRSVSLEKHRFNFGALEKHVEHLRGAVKS